MKASTMGGSSIDTCSSVAEGDDMSTRQQGRMKEQHGWRNGLGGSSIDSHRHRGRRCVKLAEGGTVPILGRCQAINRASVHHG